MRHAERGGSTTSSERLTRVYTLRARSVRPAPESEHLCLRISVRLFVGNFDFEHHLGHVAARPLSVAASRLHAELAGSLVSLTDDGDCLWTPQAFDADYARHLARIGLPALCFAREPREVGRSAILSPWGWTPELLAWGGRNGWECHCPPMAAVVAANSRGLSHRLEREWNVGIPTARECRSVDEFQQALVALPSPAAGWVVKGTFGMSARERILGNG